MGYGFKLDPSLNPADWIETPEGWVPANPSGGIQKTGGTFNPLQALQALQSLNGGTMTTTSSPSPYGFTSYNGQQVLAMSPQVQANLESSVANYNKLTGQNLSAMDYDKMLNPTTYQARWGGATGQTTPYTAGSFDFGNGVHGTPGAGTPIASNFWANPGNTASSVAGSAADTFARAGAANAGARNAGPGRGPTEAMGTAPNLMGTANSINGEGFGSQSPSGFSFTANPYAGAIGQAVTNQVRNNFLTPALNQINSGAVATGGLGGSRQGVAQGLALSQGMGMVGDGLANAYGNFWNQDQNRALSQYGMDQNFYTQQRGLDQSQFGLGLQAWNLGNQGAWTGINNASEALRPFTGYGTASGSSNSGGGWQGAIGGGIAGAQFARNMGWGW